MAKQDDIAARLASELTTLLEKHQPQSFSAAWVKSMDKKLVSRASYHSCEGSIDGWTTILLQLDPKWRARWVNLNPKRSNEEVLHEFLRLVDERQPTAISPFWIEKNDKNLLSRIKRRWPQWDEFVSLLPSSLRERWHVEVQIHGRTMNDDIAELIRLLEDEQPSSFSPWWMEQHALSLYGRFKSRLPRAGRRIDWTSVIGQLPEEWKERWGKSSVLTDQSRIEKLRRLLQAHDPNSWSPQWLIENDPLLYESIVNRFRDTKSKRLVHWDLVLSDLGEPWRSRWIRARAPVSSPLENDLKELAEILVRRDPESISAQWMRINVKTYYRRILNKTTGVSAWSRWEFILGSLGEQWKSRWSWYGVRQGVHKPVVLPKPRVRKEEAPPRVFQPRTLDTVMQDLTVVLETMDPPHVGPKWISTNAHPIYDQLRKLNVLRTSEGRIAWECVVDRLHEKWRVRWVERPTLFRMLPKNAYADPVEVRTVLDTYRSEFSAMLASSHDRKTVERGLKALVVLAQKGNLSAEQRLVDYLELIVSGQKEYERTGLLCDSEILREKLRKCVYYYRYEGSFLAYVGKSIDRYLRSLRARVVSLDQHIRGDRGKMWADVLSMEDDALDYERNESVPYAQYG